MTPRFVCAALLLLAQELSGGVFQHTKDGKTLVWNNFPSENDVASWSGKRDADGYATGKGTLTWYRTDRAFQTGSLLPSKGPAVWVSRYSGTMVRGKFNGPVTNVDADGKTFQLTFVDGTKSHGRTVDAAPSDQLHNERPHSSVTSPAEGPAPPPSPTKPASQVTVEKTKARPGPVDTPPPTRVISSPPADRPSVEVASLNSAPARRVSAPSSTSDAIEPAVKDRIIADFKEETESVFSQVSEATDHFRGVDRLEAVPKLPAAVAESVSSLVQRARDFRAKIGYEVALHDFRSETETVDALSAVDQATRSIATNDAAAANTKLADFLRSNPEPGGENQKPLWQYLSSVQQVCSRSEKEAQIHVQRAESFAAASRTSEAIRELQEAYRLFPNPETGEKIRQLQANSLGL